MQDTIDRCVGWVTQYNPLSVNKGALALADDVVIRRENVIENRRGYAVYGTAANTISQLFSYSGRVLVQNGSSIAYDNGSGTLTGYSGSYSAPSGIKSRGLEVNGNLFVSTSLGVKVFQDVAGTAARSAGMPRSLDISYALNAAGSGFLSNAFQCAYRSVLQRTDQNGNVITGYPSARLWVANSAGSSKNVDLTQYFPAEALAGDVLQVYRTDQVSGTTNDTSGDEMQLCYQYTLKSADIAAGFVTFTDSVVDSLLGATLYTSPSQEGILQANERPPLCKDLALYRSQYVFYANSSTKQRLYFSLLSTASLSGKTITLAGVTYNFGGSEIVSGGGSPQAKVSSTGVVAIDIALTAQSLVRVINRYSGNTSVYAYYVSTADGLPGQLMIEERGVGASAFTLQASDTAISAMFFPAPPVGTTSSASTSSNSVQKNYIYFSKAQQPEHVPAVNYFPVGPSNSAILRIFALRDSVIILTEKGIYRLTGENPGSFIVTPLDLTVYCKALESCAVVANQVFALTNQGVVSISDNGVQVISRDIEPNILPLLKNAAIASYTFGAGYESDRQYMMSTITADTDTAPNQTFVYNVFTRAWTRWTIGFVAASVESSSDKLFFAKPASVTLYRERKDFTDDDYADPEYACTITAVDTVNGTATFNITTVTPLVGWELFQGNSGLDIKSVFVVTDNVYRVTFSTSIPASWTTGAAILYPSVPAVVEWVPWTGGNPGAIKQIRAVMYILDPGVGKSSATAVYATFTSDLDSNQDSVRIESQGSGWGSPWGAFPWGGSAGTGFPTLVTQNKQYAGQLHVGLQHSNAHERLAVAAVTLTYEVSSDQVQR